LLAEIFIVVGAMLPGIVSVIVRVSSHAHLTMGASGLEGLYLACPGMSAEGGYF
jgi:hypothetical protein